MKTLVIATSIISLLAVGSLLFLNQKELENKDSFGLTIHYWLTYSYNPIYNSFDPCMKDPQYHATKKEFEQLTNDFIKLPECKKFYHYFNRANKNDMLNYNNYFKNCFQDRHVYEVVTSNFCFKEQIYDYVYLI